MKPTRSSRSSKLKKKEAPKFPMKYVYIAVGVAVAIVVVITIALYATDTRISAPPVDEGELQSRWKESVPVKKK